MACFTPPRDKKGNLKLSVSPSPIIPPTLAVFTLRHSNIQVIRRGHGLATGPDHFKDESKSSAKTAVSGRCSSAAHAPILFTVFLPYHHPFISSSFPCAVVVSSAAIISSACYSLEYSLLPSSLPYSRVVISSIFESWPLPPKSLSYSNLPSF